MTENRKFDNFDAFAGDYRNIHNENIKITGGSSDDFAAYKIAEILKIEGNKNYTILDFGCGDGISSVFFSKSMPKSEIHGIDISEESVKVATSRNLPKATFKPFDGHHIPYIDGFFDIVLVACVFHHIEFSLHQAVVNEIKRVLKPAGRLYIFEHNPKNPLTRKVVRECVFDKDCILLQPDYAKKMVKQAGYSSSNLVYTLFVPRHPLFKPFLPLEKVMGWFPMGGQYYIKAIK